MAKPESQRKKRQQSRRSYEDTLKVAAETVLAKHLPAASLETHEAGYWDEMGLFVEVGDEATGEQVLDLANALLERVTEASDGVDTDWTWSVSLRRADEILRVVSPGDQPRRICPNCFDEVFAVDQCSNCGFSLS